MTKIVKQVEYTTYYPRIKKSFSSETHQSLKTNIIKILISILDDYVKSISNTTGTLPPTEIIDNINSVFEESYYSSLPILFSPTRVDDLQSYINIFIDKVHDFLCNIKFITPRYFHLK